MCITSTFYYNFFKRIYLRAKNIKLSLITAIYTFQHIHLIKLFSDMSLSLLYPRGVNGHVNWNKLSEIELYDFVISGSMHIHFPLKAPLKA